jgi:hypothetical protein
MLVLLNLDWPGSSTRDRELDLSGFVKRPSSATIWSKPIDPGETRPRPFFFLNVGFETH